MAKSDFDSIYARAAERKGGEDELARLLSPMMESEALAAVPDSRFLAEMTRCLFQAGFVWRVINQKWDGFEAVFHGFDIDALLGLSTEDWDDMLQDKRIVRNGQKIRAVSANARFIDDVAMAHGSFARFIADWPCGELSGLFDFLKRRGSRLGGMTGQRFLRNIGKDTFILTADVVRALQEAGLDIADNPSSKRDLVAAQSQFNDWHAQTGLPYTQLSRIAAFSVGENYATDQVLNRSEGQSEN